MARGREGPLHQAKRLFIKRGLGLRAWVIPSLLLRCGSGSGREWEGMKKRSHRPEPFAEDRPGLWAARHCVPDTVSAVPAQQ